MVSPACCVGLRGSGLPRDSQVQINPVQQRPGQFIAIALDLLRCTPATPAGLAHVAARAGVHRRDQLKARRETHTVSGPGDHDMPRFQWLTQYLQHLAIELWQLIQEQHPVMGQSDFPRLWL